MRKKSLRIVLNIISFEVIIKYTLLLNILWNFTAQSI